MHDDTKTLHTELLPKKLFILYCVKHSSELWRLFFFISMLLHNFAFYTFNSNNNSLSYSSILKGLETAE